MHRRGWLQSNGLGLPVGLHPLFAQLSFCPVAHISLVVVGASACRCTLLVVVSTLMHLSCIRAPTVVNVIQTHMGHTFTDCSVARCSAQRSRTVWKCPGWLVGSEAPSSLHRFVSIHPYHCHVVPQSRFHNVAIRTAFHPSCTCYTVTMSFVGTVETLTRTLCMHSLGV